MNLVKIQLNHTEHLTLQELSAPFYAEIGEEYDLSEEEVAEFFNVECQLVLPNGTFVTVFTLVFPEIKLRDQTPQDVVKSYLDSLKDTDRILSIIKTTDFALFELAHQYYEEIIELEMELRNVLTYIMAYDEREIDTDLFKLFNVSLVPSFQASQAVEFYENGFFYILFSQYGEFVEPKKLGQKEVVALLQEPTLETFELFRERLIQQGISEERHINFLSSISAPVNSIEKMRNAIMHARNLSSRLVQNYKKATNSNNDTAIKPLIDAFWVQERELLKKETWLALAKSQLLKVISAVDRRDDAVVFFTNDEHYDFELDDSYNDSELLKADLIPYLTENVEVEGFHPEAQEFEAELNEVVVTTLRELIRNEFHDFDAAIDD